MVIVLTRGSITYVCQSPDRPLADWLPPARAGTMLATMSLHIFARPHAQFVLNRMCSLLLPYLYFFAPEIAFPNRTELIEGAPSSGMTITPYQLNLKGEMLPLPPELRFNQFFLFLLRCRFEDRNGTLLSSV